MRGHPSLFAVWAFGGQQAYLAWVLVLLAAVPNSGDNSKVLNDPFGVDRLPGPGFSAMRTFRGSSGSAQTLLEANKAQVGGECLVPLDSGSPEAGSCQAQCIPNTQLHSDTHRVTGSNQEG